VWRTSHLRETVGQLVSELQDYLTVRQNHRATNLANLHTEAAHRRAAVQKEREQLIAGQVELKERNATHLQKLRSRVLSMAASKKQLMTWQLKRVYRQQNSLTLFAPTE
jgi:hypothetical protein